MAASSATSMADDLLLQAASAWPGLSCVSGHLAALRSSPGGTGPLLPMLPSREP